MLKRTKKLARQRGVTVGVHSGEGAAPSGDGALSVLDVATIHEFGLGHNPERSFVRAFADENERVHPAFLDLISRMPEDLANLSMATENGDAGHQPL